MSARWNLFRILLPSSVFAWVLIGCCYLCVGLLLMMGNTQPALVWGISSPVTLFVLLAANAQRHELIEYQLRLRTPFDDRKLSHAFAGVVAVTIVPAWVLTLSFSRDASEAVSTALIWTLSSIGLALFHTYWTAVLLALILLLVLRYGLNALGFDLRVWWDMVFSLPSWLWVVVAFAIFVVGLLIDRRRIQTLRVEHRGQSDASALQITQAEQDVGELIEDFVEDAAKAFDLIEQAAVHRPSEAAMIWLMGEPRKPNKRWMFGFAAALAALAIFYHSIDAPSEIQPIALLILGFTVLAISLNSAFKLAQLTTGIEQNLYVALSPTVPRDHELRSFLIHRVVGDALSIFATMLPAAVIALGLLIRPESNIAMQITLALSSLFGIAVFACLHASLIALMYLRYCLSEVALLTVALVTASALTVVLMMSLGQWSPTPLKLGFVMFAIVSCLGCLRLKPRRLLHFVAPEVLRSKLYI